MFSVRRTAWLVGLGLTLLVGGTAGLAWLALRETGGTWVYPLDDSYIHLSLARELAARGHWGFGPTRTAFSSSSPGYTLLLALGMRFSGPWAGWPLLLNSLGALALLAQSWRLWPHFSSKVPLWLLLHLLLPLPLLWLLGLEHLLHLGLMLGLMQALSRLLSGQKPGHGWWLWAVGAALVRYETGFLIVVAGCWLMMKGRWRTAIPLGVASLLPWLLVGAWSVSQGGTWLPLSVLLKGHPPGSLAWLGAAVQRLYDNPFMLSTLLALLLGLLPAARRHLSPAQEGPQRHWLILTLFSGGLHLLFAEVGGYRYEAYWLGLALMGLGHMIPPDWSWRRLSWPGAGLGLLLIFPLLIRSGFFLWHYPQATRNIYQQPYRAAQLLRAHYAGEPVGLNDIGLGTWLGQVELTDMVGVGDQAVFRLRQQDRFTAEALDSLLRQRNVRLIVGHDIWLGSRMPARFRPVARWKVPDNFILADGELTFWVADSATAARLETALQQFNASLRNGP